MFTYTERLLKCVKEVPGCPMLAVGDLVAKTASEIWPGGYEYVVARKKSDGIVVKFRTDHLEDCFELAEIETEYPL